MREKQSVKAIAKYIRMSPNKVRRILDQIRGRSYQEALMILQFIPYRAAGPIWQVLYSAAANAQNNCDLDKRKLFISEVHVDEGPKLKWIRPRAQEEELGNIRKEAQLEITNSQKIHKEILENELNISQKSIDNLLDTITKDLSDKKNTAVNSLVTIVQSLCLEIETRLSI